VTWVKGYPFQEPLLDLREDAEQADPLAAELELEVAPGHLLHGEAWRVIARALPNDDIVVERGGHVAVVHLTWTHKPEQPPWPMTTWVASAEEFESYIET
jgi:hypothetical protein